MAPNFWLEGDTNGDLARAFATLNVVTYLLRPPKRNYILDRQVSVIRSLASKLHGTAMHARDCEVSNRYNEHVQTHHHHHNFIHIKHRMRLQIDRTTWFSGITPSHVVLRSVAAWDRIPNTVAKCSASNSGLAPTVGMGVVPTSLLREKYAPNSRLVVLNDAGKCVLWPDQVNSSRLHAPARADAGDEEPDAACEAGHFWSGVGRLK